MSQNAGQSWIISNRANGGEGFAGSYTDRAQVDDGYAFTNGQRYLRGGVKADFGSGLILSDSYDQGSLAGVGSGQYVASGGESLSVIAQQLWGDSGLWYKIASANGLSGDVTLVAGQALRLPAGVARNTFNAFTVAPYDAAEATGDLSPTNAKPGKSNKCGVFGQILLVAIAVAVIGARYIARRLVFTCAAPGRTP